MRGTLDPLAFSYIELIFQDVYRAVQKYSFQNQKIKNTKNLFRFSFLS